MNEFPIEFLLGVLIGGLGWWIALLTARMVDINDRLSLLEGRQEERDKNPALAHHHKPAGRQSVDESPGD